MVEETPARRSWVLWGARGRRPRDPHRGAHPRRRQRAARPGSAAGVPHRVDRRPVPPDRGGGLVAAAGEPARPTDDAHRLRHGADPDAVVEPAAGAQRRQLLRHAAGGALPSRLPGLPERPGPGPGRAGPRRRHVRGDARPAAGQDPARLQPRQPLQRGGRAGRRHGRRAGPARPRGVRPGRRDRAVAPAPVGPRAAAPTSGDAGRRRVQLRAGDARTALHRRPAGLVLHRADPADHLRRPGAGAARLPLRPARPAARTRRRGGSARGAAVGPDDRPGGPAGARTARPVDCGCSTGCPSSGPGPTRTARPPRNRPRPSTGGSACCLGRASRWPR